MGTSLENGEALNKVSQMWWYIVVAKETRESLSLVYQSLSLVPRPCPAFRRFTVLEAMESWAGLGNEATNL